MNNRSQKCGCPVTPPPPPGFISSPSAPSQRPPPQASRSRVVSFHVPSSIPLAPQAIASACGRAGDAVRASSRCSCPVRKTKQKRGRGGEKTPKPGLKFVPSPSRWGGSQTRCLCSSRETPPEQPRPRAPHSPADPVSCPGSRRMLTHSQPPRPPTSCLPGSGISSFPPICRSGEIPQE